MLKLLLFVPCDRVIISQGDGQTSLIALMQRLTLHGPEEPNPGEDVSAPMRWHVFTQWQKIGEEPDGREYEQSVELIDPNGKRALVNTTKFEMKAKMHRVINTLVGFPIAVQGQYELKILLRHSGSETWEEKSSYPLEVTYTTQPSGPNVVGLAFQKK